MAYNQFTTESGGSADDRRAEADRILKIIDGFESEMSSKEQGFIEQMQEGGLVSTKQLFWLRDIKAKVLGD